VTDNEDPLVHWQEDPRALLNLACGSRPDWDREETWRAIHAAHNAHIPWPRICKRLIAIAFRDGSSSPLELRDEVAQARPAEPTGPDVYARGGQLWRAALEEVQARKTGGQPVLAEGNGGPGGGSAA